MKTKSFLLLIGILFLYPNIGKSQQKQISVDEAIQLARENNLGMRSVAMDIEMQKQLKKTSTEIPKTTAMFMVGQYNSFNKDNNFTITQSLPFPTVFTSQSKLSEKRIENSEYKKASTENELVFQVKDVYLTLQYLSSQHALLERQDSIYADMVKITGLQYKTGEGTLLQKTSAEARYNEVQNLKRQNEADEKSFKTQLKILLNTEDEIILANQVLIPFTTTLLSDSSMIAKNPMLAYQRSLVDVALQEKKVEANKALPDLTFGYFNQTLIGYQRSQNGSDTFYDGNYRFSGFMAGLSFPLWFIPNHARVKSAAVKAESTRFGAYYFEKQLQGQWDKSVQEFYKNNNSLDYYIHSALPNAKLILSQSRLAYKTGEISQAEYRLNLQQALAIEEGHLKSLYLYNRSIITLEFLSGQYANQ